MKKLFLLLAVAVSSLTLSAQEAQPVEQLPQGFYGNKFFDNWYIGIDGGVSTKTTHQAVLKNLNPNFGVRVGKWITPCFGLAFDADVVIADNEDVNNTFEQQIDNSLNLDIMAQFNLMNIFGGYPGTRRHFEIIPNVGIGWMHDWTKSGYDLGIGTIKNAMTSKVGVDFAWNFGKKNQWQFYIEPEMQWLIAGAIPEYIDNNGVGGKTVAFNANYSFMQLNVGLNYRFKTSNKTHNFALVTACDEAEIAALNAEINALRAKNAELDALHAEIAKLKKALKDCEEKPAVVEKEVEPNLPAIFYPLNKSIITPAQAQNVAIAATVMKNHPELKLQVKGYASPEGPHDNNNSLSVRRAAAVKDLLVKKYGIDPSRITTEGCGETDKLFEIYEFNRVAMLYIDK